MQQAVRLRPSVAWSGSSRRGVPLHHGKPGSRHHRATTSTPDSGPEKRQAIAFSATHNNNNFSPDTAAPSQAPDWDLDWFHYTPWWYKPHIVIIAGMSFIIGCTLAEPSLKTTVIAAAPVAVGWFIFLWMVPRQFADFAKQYHLTHPEAEENARQQQAEGEREA